MAAAAGDLGVRQGRAVINAQLVVERANHAVIQDLGRFGFAFLGIPPNGASDQGAARTANVLVGNADWAPVVEVTGSDLEIVTTADLLIAATGAVEHVLVDGHPQPSWETLAVLAGSRLIVPFGGSGLRSYLAVNGVIAADRVMGSVAPDALIGVGHRLVAGDRLEIRTRYVGLPPSTSPPIFRLGAHRPTIASPAVVDAIEGPDLGRMRAGRSCLDDIFQVLPQSDHVGLRLAGKRIDQTLSTEIVSRGVPVGAVEVTPAGGIIILLRGRLVTAGYPVVAIVTSASLDRLGQVRPGDSVRLQLCDTKRARLKLADQQQARRRLAIRVKTAFGARGLGPVLDPVTERR